jgi:deoxycytidine triphosphate deaminase
MVKLREAIALPSNIGGILLPKNGHSASKGLLITNFGHVDPGFNGYLKCTVINFGQDDYVLEVGQPIACLLLFRLDEDAYPDWSTSNRHGEQGEITHARVLSQHFLTYRIGSK